MLFNEELTSLSPELNQVEGTVLQAEKQITWPFQGFIFIPLKMGVKPPALQIGYLSVTLDKSHNHIS